MHRNNNYRRTLNHHSTGMHACVSEDDLRDTRVELTFTAASRTLSVGVVKVENVSCVAQHENVKLGQMSGKGHILFLSEMVGNVTGTDVG